MSLPGVGKLFLDFPQIVTILILRFLLYISMNVANFRISNYNRLRFLITSANLELLQNCSNHNTINTTMTRLRRILALLSRT